LTLLFTAPLTTKIYTLSLHDALPISHNGCCRIEEVPCLHNDHFGCWLLRGLRQSLLPGASAARSQNKLRLPPTRSSFKSATRIRSEEHTSELQSRGHLVCRLLLEKKK